MELVAPAGNIEKLRYAYAYGADTAYIGLKKFSLRVKADNFYGEEYNEIKQLKAQYPDKRLFCALNIAFHNKDIDNFLADLDFFRQYPIDAFIIQDIGMINILKKHFPDTHLHLSTQANCINREAVKMYHDLGFNRIVLGREASLKEIREIKDAVPEMELEVFAHGAMCVAYSGRCLLSAYTTARSANSGFCSHACRWDYKVLEERERPGEYFPIFEGEDYTAVLSSKDLCMIDHLDDMKAAGVDALKIEGRMKSLYYVAMVTRAYRKQIDALEGKISKEEAAPCVAELYKAAHREFATGFYYRREDADKTTTGASDSEYELMGTIGRCVDKNEVLALAAKNKEADQKAFDEMHPQKKAAVLEARQAHNEEHIFAESKDGWQFFEYNSMNKLDMGTPLEFVGPDIAVLKDENYQFVDPKTGMIRNWISHGHECLIYTSKDIKPNFIVRAKSTEPASTVRYPNLQKELDC